ncbi:MAG: hypothetical protein JWO67_6687 [Streptosporangiaceae bacterium]|nr:hypothetical protein [Streptosporangiaceae bacterium]
MSTSDVPRSAFADYHREAASKLQVSLAAVTEQLTDLLERAQTAAVLGTHPGLIALDGELDSHYPIAES